MSEKHYDALIIGGGPAGCSCALWLKQLGLKPLILEKESQLGGLQNKSPYPNHWILGKNYPNGKAFAKAVNKQIKNENIEFSLKSQITFLRYSDKEKGFACQILKDDKTKIKLRASFIVLASGVVPKNGDIAPSSTVLVGPGVHIENTVFKGKKVAILGGGDNAFENYQFIKRQRPKVLKIFSRHVRAQISFVQKIKHGDLFLGEYFVDPIQQTVNGEHFDYLVIMYGWRAVNALEPWLSLEIKNQFVVTDALRRTSFERVYAIGEVTQASHPCCVTAMADGIIAAKDIQQRIEKKSVQSEAKKKIRK